MLRLLHQRIMTILPIMCLLSATTHAYRPFITDDAGTVTPVTFELETAADYWRKDASAGVCFKHGVTERMDIGIAFGRCVLPKDEKGYDPAELLLKFSLIPDRLSASFGGSFGSNCYSLNAIFSQPVSAVLELYANAGFSSESTLEDAFGTFSIATVFPLDRFSFGIECGGSGESFDWWQLGGRFALTDAIAIDAGIGSSIDDELSWNATTGLFFAFPTPKEGT